MVDFNFAGGDGASTGGDYQQKTLRDEILRFQENIATMLEECRKSHADLKSGQKNWLFELPDEIRDDPLFAEVVERYDRQLRTLENVMTVSVASTEILETWLTSVRELLKLIGPHLP